MMPMALEGIKVIDVSQVAAAPMCARHLADFYRKRIPNPMANTYETRDGKSIRFNALQADRYWSKFCKLIGREELEPDPRFATLEAHQENRKELYHIFREAFLNRTLEEWRPLLSDLPASPVQTLVDVINDPQARANNFFLPYDHPTYGRIEIMASTPRRSSWRKGIPGRIWKRRVWPSSPDETRTGSLDA